MGQIYRIPFRWPENPYYVMGVVGSLKQQRFLTAVKLHFPDHLESVCQAIWFRIYSEDMDIGKESSLGIVGKRGGLNEEEIEKCLELMGKDEVKQELTKESKKAVKFGAFGLPWSVIHHRNIDKAPEVVWGSDRFELIAKKFGKTFQIYFFKFLKPRFYL